MSQTVIGLPDDLPDGAQIRVLILGHHVRACDVIVDVRSSLFGSWTPVRRERLSHRTEGDLDDRGSGGGCRCCSGSVAAVDSGEADAGETCGSCDEVWESRVRDLQTKADELILALARRVDHLLLQRDAAEAQMVGLRAEQQRLEAMVRESYGKD